MHPAARRFRSSVIAVLSLAASICLANSSTGSGVKDFSSGVLLIVSESGLHFTIDPSPSNAAAIGKVHLGPVGVLNESKRAIRSLFLEVYAVPYRAFRNRPPEASWRRLTVGTHEIGGVAAESEITPVPRALDVSLAVPGSYWIAIVLRSSFATDGSIDCGIGCFEDSIVTDEPVTIAPHASQPPFPDLELTILGAGAGNVRVTPGDLDCNAAQCVFRFPYGTAVRLTATPGSHMHNFAGYRGCSLDSERLFSCTFTLISPTTIEVSFSFTPPPPFPPVPGPTSMIENPAAGSYQSGIGLISGWSCDGSGLAVQVGTRSFDVQHGSGRNDVAATCGGDANVGFGLLFNYNNFGPGRHTMQLLQNGVPIGSAREFTVTVPNGEYMQGLSREITVPNFPAPGRTTTLIWQESQQNFAIKSVAP